MKRKKKKKMLVSCVLAGPYPPGSYGAMVAEREVFGRPVRERRRK